jgi:hypothetical protein
MQFGPHAPPASKIILADLVRNACKRNQHCNHWDPLTIDLFTAMSVRGGPAVVEFAGKNVGGPSAALVRDNLRKDRHVLLPGLDQSNVDFAIEFYSAVIEKLDLPQGSVPFSIAVDETVIVPALSMDGTSI